MTPDHFSRDRPLRRHQRCMPGFDCIRNPCGRNGCTSGRSPQNHGVRNDIWIYAVSDGLVAMELEVSSGVYPASVPASVAVLGSPSGSWLRGCTHYPTTLEAVRDGLKGADCRYVGSCFVTTIGASEAEAFFESFGSPTYDQPEPFWEALEAQWSSFATEQHKLRKDLTFEPCSKCDATGTVVKKPPKPEQDAWTAPWGKNLRNGMRKLLERAMVSMIEGPLNADEALAAVWIDQLPKP